MVQERAGVQLRVEVAAAGDDGRRAVQVFSRQEITRPGTGRGRGMPVRGAGSGGGGSTGRRPRTWRRGRRPERPRWTCPGSTSSWPRPGWSTGPRSGGCGRPGGAAMRSSPRWRCRKESLVRGSGCTRRCWTPRCTPPAAGGPQGRRGAGAVRVERGVAGGRGRVGGPGPDHPGRAGRRAAAGRWPTRPGTRSRSSRSLVLRPLPAGCAGRGRGRAAGRAVQHGLGAGSAGRAGTGSGRRAAVVG